MANRLVVAVVALLAVISALLLGQSKPSIQGVWRVAEVTTTGPNANTNKSLQPGLYIFTGKQEELVKALDPEWPGPIPHTLLIDAKGNVLWRHNGQVDGDELRAKILEHLGTYYTP